MKERLPEIAQGGKPIEIANLQPEVRKNAELAHDWKYSEEMDHLYIKAVIFRERLLDPIARVDRNQLPDPIIGVENLRNYKVLAEYLVGRDAVGLSCRINFNEEHYIEEEGKMAWRFGRWAQYETLLHEYVHLWQQQIGFGKEPFKPGKSRSPHNKEFIQKCESIGLHIMPDVGCHIAVADEPFSVLMKEWGVERPNDVPRDDRRIDWFKFLIELQGKEVKGRSSLNKWTCPECGLNVRMGIAGDPMLRHHICETAAGRPVFLIPGDVYSAKK